MSGMGTEYVRANDEWWFASVHAFVTTCNMRKNVAFLDMILTNSLKFA